MMITAIEVEVGVPAPKMRVVYAYPYEDMDVGDSILITEAQKAESARVAAIQFSKRHGLTWKFGLRKSREGWRVIRIA